MTRMSVLHRGWFKSKLVSIALMACVLPVVYLSPLAAQGPPGSGSGWAASIMLNPDTGSYRENGQPRQASLVRNPNGHAVWVGTNNGARFALFASPSAERKLRQHEENQQANHRAIQRQRVQEEDDEIRRIRMQIALAQLRQVQQSGEFRDPRLDSRYEPNSPIPAQGPVMLPGGNVGPNVRVQPQIVPSQLAPPQVERFTSRRLGVEFTMGKFADGMPGARLSVNPPVNSPLWQGGLQAGDIVIGMDDSSINHPEEMDNHHGRTSVDFVRGNRRMSAMVNIR